MIAGLISTGGSAKSVQGYGTESWTVSGNPSVVSVTAQKRDADMGRMTVKIMKVGTVGPVDDDDRRVRRRNGVSIVWILGLSIRAYFNPPSLQVVPE